MTQDELRRLMGAYATGSLSDAERKALFEAALDDQDLFDELAREQAIQETIAEPGARDRLIARLASDAPGASESATGGWRKGLAWGLAASFVLSMSVAAVVIMRSSMSPGHAQLDAKLETPARPSEVAPGGTASQPTSVQPAAEPAAVPRPAPVPLSTNAPGRGDRGTAREKKVAVNGFRPVDTLAEKEKRVEKPAEARSGKENDNGRLPSGSAASTSGAAAGSTSNSTTGSTAVATIVSPAAPAPVPVRAPAPAIADLPVEGRREEPVRKDAAQIAQSSESGKSQDAKSQQNKAELDKIQRSDQVQVTTSAGRVEQSTLAQNRDAQANRIQNSRVQASQPAAPQAKSIAQLQPGQAGTAKDGSRAKAAPAGLIGGAIGGDGGGGRGGAAARPAHFAFDYAVSEATVGEELTLKFAADGYISIHFVPGGVTVVAARVTAGSTRRERIPNNATEIDLLFTASQQAGAPGATITREPKDARSGSAEDPGGARIDLLLRLY